MIKDLLWNIKAFLHQPIIPTVPMNYVIIHNGSHLGNDFMKDRYEYYWIGDFKTGRQVKVRSLDIARYRCLKFAQTIIEMEKDYEIKKISKHDRLVNTCSYLD
jgi:hypothetical protein